MTTDSITVEPEDPIRTVADMYIISRVRRVPVVKHGRLVGLIARRDVHGIFDTILQAGAV